MQAALPSPIPIVQSSPAPYAGDWPQAYAPRFPRVLVETEGLSVPPQLQRIRADFQPEVNQGLEMNESAISVLSARSVFMEAIMAVATPSPVAAEPAQSNNSSLDTSGSSGSSESSECSEYLNSTASTDSMQASQSGYSASEGICNSVSAESAGVSAGHSIF